MSQIDEDDFGLSWRLGENSFQAHTVSLDHQMVFQIFFHTVTFLSTSLCCVFRKKKNPSLHATTFLKDPTETEDQRHLLSFYGRRFRQFRPSLICMAFTCRHSNNSLHKAPKNSELSKCITPVSDLAARTSANLSKSFLRSFVYR